MKKILGQKLTDEGYGLHFKKKEKKKRCLTSIERHKKEKAKIL